jgi:hypothetical protein
MHLVGGLLSFDVKTGVADARGLAQTFLSNSL